MDPSVTRSRREFLERVAIAMAGAGAACAVPLHRNGTGVMPPPDLTPANSSWDLSWLRVLRAATYRAVFDSPAIANGIMLELAAEAMDEFADVYGARDGTVGVAIVVRSLGTPLCLDDTIWRQYSIGSQYSVNDPETNKPATRNPFYRSAAAVPPGVTAGTLESLQHRGAFFLVCDLALNHMATQFAASSGRPSQDVRAELQRGLVPGATIVPSGIFGLIRAQNAGCALVKI